MNYTILTSFNEKYWNEIAKDNIKLLDQHWLAGQEILLYHQLPNAQTENFSSRVKWIDLYQNCPDLVKFCKDWKDDPKANGNLSQKPNMAFRWNAIKFAHKTFAIWHAAKKINKDWIIWLDCDAFLFNPVDTKFISKIFQDTKAICYLGRKGKYSECGFLAFNLNHPQTKIFLNVWEQLHITGEFINLSETHDSYTFDHIRKNNFSQDIFFDLNAMSNTDKNPFSNSLINSHFAHAKGLSKEKTSQKLKSKFVKE